MSQGSDAGAFDCSTLLERASFADALNTWPSAVKYSSGLWSVAHLSGHLGNVTNLPKRALVVYLPMLLAPGHCTGRFLGIYFMLLPLPFLAHCEK